MKEFFSYSKYISIILTLLSKYMFMEEEVNF